MAEAKELKGTKIYPLPCPVCGKETNSVWQIQEGNTDRRAMWYRCQGGVLFQEHFPTNDIYHKEYLETYSDEKKAQARMIHAGKIYAPIIEETTYGRMMLDVGFGMPYNLMFFEERGWLVWGIEVNDAISPGKNIYKGDFLTYDFSPHINKERLKSIVGEKAVIKRTFDLIWMSHVLEHFNDPMAVLKKAYDLLSPTGVLYISTPDIDFINKTGVTGWLHFKKQEHYTLWTERALVRELKRIGFNIILKKRNFSSRFVSWFDVHVIAQKDYF